MRYRLPILITGLISGLVLTAQASAAGGLSSLVTEARDSQFLPVEQAFSANAEMKNASTAHVHWDIADGYYLYKHQLRFSLVDAAGASLGQPKIPAGTKKEDDYFGTVEVYHHTLDVELPLSGTLPESGALMLQVRYQGCAERGLCYPPQTVKLPLVSGGAVDNSGTHANGKSMSATTESNTTPTEQDRLAQLIGNKNLALVLLSFFGLGVLLAFTPCVLPMLPILSGIIAGAEGRVGALRGFTLSLSYVLAMALAYTIFGVIAGLTGANLQAAMQNPWVISGFSALFVVLALSMFGFYHLQLPAALQTRLTHHSNRQKGGSLVGAAIMGFLSALIVGPCLAPPLAGALLYISRTGDAVLGGLALFALGLGIGVPLLVLGVAEGSVLPRAGAWMDSVKHFFGILLLGVAIWMMGRILPGPLTLALWAGLAFTSAVVLGLFEPGNKKTSQRVRKGLSLLVAAYGLILLTGATTGAGDPLHPLERLTSRQTETAAALNFRSIKSVADLNAALADASAQHRPAMLDFYADWCVGCVKMEHEVFPDPAVHQALSGVLLLRADVTANDGTDQALLKHLGVFGPPTILFFGTDGAELREHRLVGERDVAGLVEHVHATFKN